MLISYELEEEIQICINAYLQILKPKLIPSSMIVLNQS